MRKLGHPKKNNQARIAVKSMASSLRWHCTAPKCEFKTGDYQEFMAHWNEKHHV